MAWRTAACLTLLVAEAEATCIGRAQATCDGGCQWTSTGCRDVNPSNQCGGRLQNQCSGDCQWSGSYCQQVCYHSNVAYTGDMPGQSITNEASRDNCKARCTRTGGCQYFTYYTNSRNCHLQDATASRQSQVGAVSGRASCNNNQSPAPAPQPAPSPRRRRAFSGGGSQQSMPPSVGAATALGRVNTGNAFSGLVQQLQPGAVSALVQQLQSAAVVAKLQSVFPGWQLGAFAGAASLLGALALLRGSSRRSSRTRSEEEEEHTQALAAPDSE